MYVKMGVCVCVCVWHDGGTLYRTPLLTLSGTSPLRRLERYRFRIRGIRIWVVDARYAHPHSYEVHPDTAPVRARQTLLALCRCAWWPQARPERFQMVAAAFLFHGLFSASAVACCYHRRRTLKLQLVRGNMG